MGHPTLGIDIGATLLTVLTSAICNEVLGNHMILARHFGPPRKFLAMSWEMLCNIEQDCSTSKSWQCHMGRTTWAESAQLGRPHWMCQEPDSAGHILGGCLHEYPKWMIIKRQNEAVWELQRTIRADTQGGHFTILDAGLLDHMCTMPQGLTPTRGIYNVVNTGQWRRQGKPSDSLDGTTDEAQTKPPSAPLMMYADNANHESPKFKHSRGTWSLRSRGSLLN